MSGRDIARRIFGLDHCSWKVHVRTSISRILPAKAERDGIKVNDIVGIIRRPASVVANPRRPDEQCIVRGQLPDGREISILSEPRFFDVFRVAQMVHVIDYNLVGTRGEPNGYEWPELGQRIAGPAA